MGIALKALKIIGDNELKLPQEESWNSVLNSQRQYFNS